MVSMIDHDDEVKSFIGERCFDDFLSYLANKHGNDKFNLATKLELYAHNSTYDGSFLMRKLLNLQILEKDSKYVSMKGVYMSKDRNFVELLVKDSYRLIPMRLSEIPGACGFKDEAQKEVMYYDMFNHTTMQQIRNMKKKDLIKYIDDYDKNSHATKAEALDKRNTFFSNLQTWRCINEDKTYDLMKYSQIYCEQDCKA